MISVHRIVCNAYVHIITLYYDEARFYFDFFNKQKIHVFYLLVLGLTGPDSLMCTLLQT